MKFPVDMAKDALVWASSHYDFEAELITQLTMENNKELAAKDLKPYFSPCDKSLI